MKPFSKGRIRKMAVAAGTLITIFASAFFASPSVLVVCVSNDHVAWDGTIVGLVPRATGWGEYFVRLRGRDCTPYLLSALDDDERYVAAHVLLSYLFEETRPEINQLRGGAWDNLEVVLHADGRTEIPEGQKEKLRQIWNERLGGA